MSRWRRSRFCDDTACVQVAITSAAVHVRNSTSPGTVLSFTHTEWVTFLAGATAGDFNLQEPTQ